MSAAQPDHSYQWQSELNAFVDRFESAWTAGQPTQFEDFLPADHVARQVVLLELIHVDLERRLAAGEQIRVEEYLGRYPDLAQDRAIVIQLVLHEFRQRRRNASVTPQEYEIRFSQYWKELRVHLADSDQLKQSSAFELHCPHCRTRIEVVGVTRNEEKVCPSCGSSFRLDPEQTQEWPRDRLPTLDKFELIEEVGRGAFGTVYRARDIQLHRIVAVKIPRSGQLASRGDEDRFMREARSTAQLKHVGIVQVFEIGRGGSFPYIVSEFVEGITLADTLTGRTFSFREAAELAASVAEAIEHAHRQGVVHRDLKPSNIMLTTDGKARLMDFGLAKRDAGEITVTLDGQVLGTPAYMSPEQAAGDGHQVDGRSAFIASV